MIDTIILRIHGTRKYRSIIKTLDNCDSKGFTTKTGKVDKAEMARLRNQRIHSTDEILDIMKMNGTGEFLVKTKYAKHQNASSHYTFSWMANYTADYIEFNFSIPKYVYGSNVLMFTDHIGDRDYTFHDCWHLKTNFERGAGRLGRFINEFFAFEFPLTKINFKDVEVNRIDVCFNQMFRTKGEALKYLEYQKRQNKKYSRNQENVMKEYETSLMYVTKRYSAKIYHKGSEYKKNDSKEHLKINEQKGKQYFRVEDYQAFADRMLRYELTIRNAELNYLHKKHLFRKNCPFFQPYYKVYLEVENALQTNDRIAKRIGELPNERKESYRKEHPYIRIDREDKRVYKGVSHLINKKTLFKFSVDERVNEYNKGLVDYDCNEARFSAKLLMLCFDKLVAFMKEYQIKELPEEGKIEKLIVEYNLRHKVKLPKSHMMGYYSDLLRLGSFKAVAKFNYSDRSTMFRYKARFKKIGITEKNLIPLTEDGIPLAELNLRDYHYEHQFNPHFIKKTGFLDLRDLPKM